jgi:hypothetical protein
VRGEERRSFCRFRLAEDQKPHELAIDRIRRMSGVLRSYAYIVSMKGVASVVLSDISSLLVSVEVPWHVTYLDVAKEPLGVRP